jgi:hypothetical protein
MGASQAINPVRAAICKMPENWMIFLALSAPFAADFPKAQREACNESVKEIFWQTR